MKKLKLYLSNKPRLKKCLKILGITFVILNFLWYLLLNVSLVVGAFRGNEQVEEKPQILSNKVTMPIRNVVYEDLADGYYEDSTYRYFSNVIFNERWYQYLETLYDNGVIYEGMSVDSVDVMRSSNYSGDIPTANKNYNGIHLNLQNSDSKYIELYRSSGTSYRVIINLKYQNKPAYTTYYYYQNGSSLVTDSVYYFRVSKNSQNIGAWFYSAYQYATQNQYTQADLDQAYQNGYQAGLSEGGDYSPIINEVVINQNYDFRRLFSNNIDTETGLFQLSITGSQELDFYEYAISGGSSWNIGKKRYNAIVFSVMRLDDAQYVSKNGSKTEYVSVSSLIGDSGKTLFGLQRVDYIYINGLEQESTYQKLGAEDSINYLTSAEYSLNVYMYETILTGFNDSTKPSILPNYQLKWKDNGFRYLTEWESEDSIVRTPQYSTLTLNQLLSLNDKAILNNDSVNSNLFTLLGQGFKSIANVLNINILPNISLGMLVFLPLVVTIVLFIVKLLRK